LTARESLRRAASWTKARAYFGLLAVSFLILSSSLIVVFAVEPVSTTANPSSASPNTTINLENAINMAAVADPSLTNFVVKSYTVVLTPSGSILGCELYCSGQAQSGTSSGTFTCTVPFGGAVASESSSTSGGVTEVSPPACNVSDANAWGPVFPEAPGYCSNNPCSGAGDFAGLQSFCNSDGGSSVFQPGPYSQGDTSQPGTYSVLTCWGEVPGEYIDLVSFMASQTSFTITQSAGVPQFPLGIALLLAVMVPVLLVLRKRTVFVHKA
jgi:hypothetical protein